MGSRLLLLVLASSGLLLACNGGIIVATGGNGGSAGSGGSGASGGSGGTGGIAGSGGVGGVGGVGGSGGSCGQTHDAFSYDLAPAIGGGSLSCAGAEPGTGAFFHLEGVVMTADGTSATIDTCPPNADCDASATYKLTVDAPGAWLSLWQGLFVQIDVQIDYPWGCSQTLMIRNLPVWEGLTSPGGDQPWVVLAGSDGSPSAPAGAPFGIEAIALGCGGGNMGCGVEEDYLLRFSTPDGSQVDVFMGETAWFGMYTGRNLRSYETGWCDDYWNWAWCVSLAPLEG